MILITAYDRGDGLEKLKLGALDYSEPFKSRSQDPAFTTMGADNATAENVFLPGTKVKFPSWARARDTRIYDLIHRVADTNSTLMSP